MLPDVGFCMPIWLSCFFGCTPLPPPLPAVAPRLLLNTAIWPNCFDALTNVVATHGCLAHFLGGVGKQCCGIGLLGMPISWLSWQAVRLNMAVWHACLAEFANIAAPFGCWHALFSWCANMPCSCARPLGLPVFFFG